MTTLIYTKIKTPRKTPCHKKSLIKRRNHYYDRVKIIHNNKYTYPFIEDFKGQRSRIKVNCNSHGIFDIRANDHLSGTGCKKCYIESMIKNNIKSQIQFEKEARSIHGDRYKYGKYNGAQNKMDICCIKHNLWYKQVAGSILRKFEGCKYCESGGYSKVSIKWLNSINSDIQHALNGGEYRIPSTKYRVDGYDSETNTVYEFHGDSWHGNPNLYEDDEKCHPFNKDITAKELYQKTIERENEIKSLGYNLVVMWENDYK